MSMPARTYPVTYTKRFQDAKDKNNLDLVYQELKAPIQKAWNEITSGLTLDEIHECIRESRNIGLKVDQYPHHEKTKLLLIDIDYDDEQVRELVKHAAALGAFVCKTLRGYHIFLSVPKECVSAFAVKVFFVESFRFEVAPDKSVDIITSPPEGVANKASKQVILPIKGTPRYELAPNSCYVHVCDKQEVNRGFTFEEIIDALERMLDTTCVGVEVFTSNNLQEYKTDYKYKDRDSAYNVSSRKRRKWSDIFGKGYSKNPEQVYDRVRKAKVGERNNMLYTATMCLIYHNYDEDEVTERLLEICKEIFTDSDIEARNDYRQARRTIESAIRSAKAFRDSIMEHRKAPKDGDDSNDGVISTKSKTDKIIEQAVKLLSSDGACFYESAEGRYILHYNNAVHEDKILAYLLDVFRLSVTENSKSKLIDRLSVALPRLNETINKKVIILRNFVRTRLNTIRSNDKGFFDQSYEAFIPLRFIYFFDDIDKQLQLDSYRELFRTLRSKLRYKYIEEFEDVIRKIFDSNCNHNNYIHHVLLDGNTLVSRFYRHNVHQRYLDDTIYYNYTGESNRNVFLPDFINYCLGYILDTDTEEEKEKKKDIIINALYSIANGTSFEFRLCDVDNLHKTNIRDYLLQFAFFHSISIIKDDKITIEELESEKYTNYFIAKSLALITMVALESGVVLIEGPSGSGKTVLSQRLAYLSDGKYTATNSKDDRDVMAAAHNYKTIIFEESGKISNVVQEIVKTITTGTQLSRRALFTDADLKNSPAYKHSVIIVNTEIEDLAPDLSRRMLSIYMDPVRFDNKFDNKVFILYAGQDALYIPVLSVAVFAANRKKVSSTSYNSFSNGLRKVRIQKKDDRIARFIKKVANQIITTTYIAVTCDVMKISPDVAIKVYEEAQIKAVLSTLHEYWRNVYDFITNHPKASQLIGENNAKTMDELVNLLVEERYISNDDKEKYKNVLSKTYEKANNAFRVLGYELKYKKVGRVNAYWFVGIDSETTSDPTASTYSDALSSDNPF